ncbi:MAG TPA: hypothetical protein DIT99_24015 [Candidatus Latescibacteria bacterium]|nr:hypothetical protein [Candidatus Latescibacterota bacterium]
MYLGPGEIFGEQGLVGKKYCNANVSTLEESVLCQFESTAVGDIMEADRTFAEIFENLIHSRSG